MKGAWSITAKELSRRHKEGNIPKECVPHNNLVCNVPGTLSYNSPGALGFGVKRAALVIPQSVMLLVAPDCCGRNSTILSENEGYASRMFYLRMSENDVITGAHLKLIPSAIKEVCNTSCPRPRVVVICVTCVDALLGTDVEKVCRDSEMAVTDVRVVPSYMYALTRDGTKPPMTAIRDAIYSLLVRREIERETVNLMGFFSPLSMSSELFIVLDMMGIKRINQVSQTKTLEEYMLLGAANFNLVLNSEALYAAEKLKDRLGIPYIELHRLYDTDRIEKQYLLFAAALGCNIPKDALSPYKTKALEAINAFRTSLSRTASFAIGQMLNASPFEMSYALCKMGFRVPYIIATPSSDEWQYVGALAGISPDTLIIPPTHPSVMLFKADREVDIAVGKDIAQMFPAAALVTWNSEEEPFGFMAVRDFFNACRFAVQRKWLVSAPPQAGCIEPKCREAE